MCCGIPWAIEEDPFRGHSKLLLTSTTCLCTFYHMEKLLSFIKKVSVESTMVVVFKSFQLRSYHFKEKQPPMWIIISGIPLPRHWVEYSIWKFLKNVIFLLGKDSFQIWLEYAFWLSKFNRFSGWKFVFDWHYGGLRNAAEVFSVGRKNWVTESKCNMEHFIVISRKLSS